jgi:histidinol-phosphatase (PHP family)
MIDLHIHSHASSDAKGSLRDYWQQAKDMGVRTFCVTNHLEVHNQKPGIIDIDFERDNAKYRREFEEAASIKEGPEVLLGIELGNRYNYRHHMEKYIRSFDWDYLAGSAHVVDNFGIAGDHGIGYFKDKSESTAYNRYFNAVERMLEWGVFDGFAHFDIIKRNGITFFGPFSAQRYRDPVFRLLKLMKQKTIALELNTSGYFQNPGEPYPGRAILEMAWEAGIRRITIGSDCHGPEHLARGVPEGIKLLKEIGFKELTVFRKRKPFGLEI